MLSTTTLARDLLEVGFEWILLWSIAVSSIMTARCQALFSYDRIYQEIGVLQEIDPIIAQEHQKL
jgi:hypothetical protein